MEDRSLRNIRVRGDRGSIPAKGGIFSSANFIRNLSANDNSDNLEAVATSLLSEEERNLEKWPMTSSDCGKMTSSTLIAQH